MAMSWILLNIAGLWIVAAMVPGPNFLLTMRTALVKSRSEALITVLGIASGTLVWGLAGLLGLSLILEASPNLTTALQFLGSSYLIYLGIRIFRSDWKSDEEAVPTLAAFSKIAAWRRGLMTNLANPKTAAFVASLFATTLPSSASIGAGLTAVATITVVSWLWYSLVAATLGHASLSSGRLMIRTWAGPVASVALIVAGIKSIVF